MAMTEFDPQTDDLLVGIDGGVVTFTLNRPDRLNAFTPDMTRALGAGLDAADADGSVRAVVLTGAGRGFCAGGDVQGQRARATGDAPAETVDAHRSRLVRSQLATSARLHRIGTPTIAAVNGPAAGAGLSLALACDLRIAARSAVLTTAFARVGFSGDYGGSWFLTHLVGTAKAKELYFTSARLTADEAAELGIVNRVVDDDGFAEAAAEFAAEIAAGPSLAHGYMKANLNRALTDDLETCLEHEAFGMIATSRSDDHREGATAFTEKRPPRFVGR